MASQPPGLRDAIYSALSESQLAFLLCDWRFRARETQLAPPGGWRCWLFLGGRGAGKTRAGAEWVAEGVRAGRMRRVALVGASLDDVRKVMIEGPSGLKSAAREARYEPANRRMTWPGGAVATVFSADEPDSIRGHQFDAVWADEFCKWPDPQGALDMLRMALRLGSDPRLCVTTTPRNIAALRTLMEAADTAVTRSTTRDNGMNLAPKFVDELEGRYGGTRLGRQELDGDLIEDNEAALWKREWIESGRVAATPPMKRVIIGVDPPAGRTGAACGIVAAGRGQDGAFYVLGDCSVQGLTSAQWAERVAGAFETHQADRIVAEANQGGDMVREVIGHRLENAPITLVHATRDKYTRAMPAASLYERGRVHHVGAFPKLEDQLCGFDGTGPSPDRLDALVWALAHLSPLAREPKVRTL
ncbi:MAG TPA: terminase family protein [Rhizomicrobium sp.]|nr:terminase family protein [Rhizomicrobium sp.]